MSRGDKINQKIISEIDVESVYPGIKD